MSISSQGTVPLQPPTQPPSLAMNTPLSTA
jgi:hypothetical protein